jgi:hypothetical protein
LALAAVNRLLNKFSLHFQQKANMGLDFELFLFLLSIFFHTFKSLFEIFIHEVAIFFWFAISHIVQHLPEILGHLEVFFP